MKKSELFEKIEFLEERIRVLERENIETTNSLYELENRIDAKIESLKSKEANGR